MAQPIPVVAEATAVPELRVAPPSLAAAMTTAMAMVDYVLTGSATPTPEPQTVAQELSSDIADASHPLRAALAHGTSLRAYLLERLPTDHPAHHDWQALRGWLAGLTDEEVYRLIAHGIAAVLGYGKPSGTTPTATEVGSSEDAFRRHGAVVLGHWRVPDPQQRVDELLDLASVREILLALLDAIWELWLDRAWSEQLPALRAAVERAPAPPTGAGGAQWISLVTGLRPDPHYAELADRAATVVLMPCPGLGRSLSLFTVADDDAWVLYTPAAEAAATAPRERIGIAVQRLADLAPTLHALGDRTRLAIALHLLEHGPLSMQQLTDTLQVHQSTISRQVAALRKAGVVEADEQRRIAVNRPALQRAIRTLQEAVE